MWHWPYWTRWISKASTWTTLFHKGIPNAAQYLHPLRKKLPDQDFTITLRELMASISESDNNACDILIEYAGGIKHINDYIRRLGIDSFNLSETEDDMHSSFEAVYRNWSTPSAMARLLRTADEKELFSNKELKRLLVADHDRY